MWVHLERGEGLRTPPHPRPTKSVRFARQDLDLEIKTGYDDDDYEEEGDGQTALDLAEARLLDTEAKLRLPCTKPYSPQQLAEKVENLKAIVALLKDTRRVAVPAAEEAAEELLEDDASSSATATVCPSPIVDATVSAVSAAAGSSSSDDDDE